MMFRLMQAPDVIPWCLVALLPCLHVISVCFLHRQYSRMSPKSVEKVGNFPMLTLQKALEWVNSPGEKV